MCQKLLICTSTQLQHETDFFTGADPVLFVIKQLMRVVAKGCETKETKDIQHSTGVPERRTEQDKMFAGGVPAIISSGLVELQAFHRP